MKLYTPLLAILLSLTFSSLLLAETLSARQIMEKVDARDTGDYSAQILEMILIDSNGDTRERLIQSYGRNAGENGEDNESIMFFMEPADIKNTAFLTYDYDDDEKDDGQWLFLPALKKTKRIASSDKSGSFMGTDFSYADMTSRNLDYYDYRILQETKVRGEPVWIIEAISNNKKEVKETGYSKSLIFVRKDNFVVIRSKNWVKENKTEKYMDVKKLEQIDGIWVATEMIMTTKRGKMTEHKTIMRAKEVKFNQYFDKDIFTVRRLEKGL